MEFSYFLPVNIQFGWNKVDNVADFCCHCSKKALIVTGRTSAKNLVYTGPVVAKLYAAHIGHVLLISGCQSIDHNCLRRRCVS